MARFTVETFKTVIKDIDDNEKALRSTENRVILATDVFLESLGELNALHAAITRDEGEVAGLLDEVEKFSEIRMPKVRSLREGIREKQKNMRRIEAKLFRASQALAEVGA